MKKIMIVGLTGSGKTTLAIKIKEVLNIPVFYLDIFFWKEKGGMKDIAFTKIQEEIMLQNEKWIIDGGFPRSKSLEIRIKNADTVIFFDLPLRVIFWRQLKRYIKYNNKVRPDMGLKQPFPFTWKDIKYSINYPTKDIYEKIQQYGNNNKVFIIKNNKDQNEFLKILQN